MTYISRKICAAAAAMALVFSQAAVCAFADSAEDQEISNAEGIDVTKDVSADEVSTDDETSTDEETTAEEEIIADEGIAYDAEVLAAEEPIEEEPIVEEKYTKGDVNNDGNINVTDIVKIAAHIKSKKILSETAQKAADVNDDNKINVTDISIIAAHIKGIRAINWLELLDTIEDSKIVSETTKFIKLDDIVSPRGNVTVNWTAVEGASGYDIHIIGSNRTEKYQARSNKYTFDEQRWVDDDVITVKVMPYTYYNTESRQGVKSYTDGYQCKLTVKPANVSGLKAVSERNYVKVSWKASADADVYNVYYKVDGKEHYAGQFADCSVKVNVSPEKDYEFRVLAVNTFGKSYVNADKSSKVKVHTLPYYSKAAAVLDQVGWDLHKAFDWCAMPYAYYINGEWLPRDGSPGMEWYADRGFDAHEGNCYVMAACFCEMAKMLGYDAHQISSCTITRNGTCDHSWVEIDNYNGSGKSYIFDPDFQSELGRNGFAISYGDKGTLMYDINGKYKRVIMS